MSPTYLYPYQDLDSHKVPFYMAHPCTPTKKPGYWCSTTGDWHHGLPLPSRHPILPQCWLFHSHSFFALINRSRMHWLSIQLRNRLTVIAVLNWLLMPSVLLWYEGWPQVSARVFRRREARTGARDAGAGWNLEGQTKMTKTLDAGTDLCLKSSVFLRLISLSLSNPPFADTNKRRYYCTTTNQETSNTTKSSLRSTQKRCFW